MVGLSLQSPASVHSGAVHVVVPALLTLLLQTRAIGAHSDLLCPALMSWQAPKPAQPCASIQAGARRAWAACPQTTRRINPAHGLGHSGLHTCLRRFLEASRKPIQMPAASSSAPSTPATMPSTMSSVLCPPSPAQSCCQAPAHRHIEARTVADEHAPSVICPLAPAMPAVKPKRGRQAEAGAVPDKRAASVLGRITAMPSCQATQIPAAAASVHKRHQQVHWGTPASTLAAAAVDAVEASWGGGGGGGGACSTVTLATCIQSSLSAQQFHAMGCALLVHLCCGRQAGSV